LGIIIQNIVLRSKLSVWHRVAVSKLANTDHFERTVII